MIRLRFYRWVRNWAGSEVDRILAGQGRCPWLRDILEELVIYQQQDHF